jgi:flagellar hook-basal body complex protein FliE
MVSPIGASTTGAIGTAAGASASAGGGAGTDFQDLFAKAVSGVENLRQSADQGIERFLSGEGDELHSVVMATQKADLAFELFLQVRNKVVSAYQEIMRMQI